MTKKMYVEKIEALVNKINTSNDAWAFDDIDSVKKSLEGFCNYVAATYRMVSTMKTVCVEFEGAERVQMIKTVDSGHKYALDEAFRAAHVLNSICEHYGVEKLCPETNDRFVIADFCAAVTIHFYCVGQFDRTVDMEGIVAAMEAGEINLNRKEV